MSFSFDAKNEVVLSPLPENICCCKAQLSALIRTCGTLMLVNKHYQLQLNTELPNLFDRVSGLIEKIYQKKDILILKEEERVNHMPRYLIDFPVEFSEQVLEDCYVLKREFDGGLSIIRGISRHLVENECCNKNFIVGAFLGCASANIVIKDINNLKKHTGGYHLEFVFSQNELASDFSHLLASCDIMSKMMVRKKLNVVYIKEAELVSDVLAMVGANNAVMTLQNEFAVREVRNQLNRQLNCLNSNMEKMVNASIKQIQAIEYIRDTVGLEVLPANLYELCILRLANPEETLDNLAKLMTEPLTKSGINHRLRKLMKMAEEIKKEEDKVKAKDSIE